MATKLQIINKALIKMGCETIAAITDETKAVRLINTIYDNIVQEELQKHNWIFAKSKAVIYANDILETVQNVAELTVADVILGYDNNVLTITAQSAGTEGNSIEIKSSNKKIVCSGQTLQGGSATANASATITFNVNMDKNDSITIGSTELVAGRDFAIGKICEGRFAREFDLPVDYLLLLEIEGFNALTSFPYQYGEYKQYDVAGRKLYCNKDSVVVFYTATVGETDFDYNFINVLCCRLAYELADVLSQDDNKKKTWFEEYMIAIRDAKKVNAIQMPNSSIGTGVMERARVF